MEKHWWVSADRAVGGRGGENERYKMRVEMSAETRFNEGQTRGSCMMQSISTQQPCDVTPTIKQGS